MCLLRLSSFFFFFFNDTATTEIYTLSLHDALPICKALEGCNDHLVLTRPDIIQSIHESFLAVGCDVVETCTFQSTPHRDRKSTRLNSSHANISYAVFCLKKKKYDYRSTNAIHNHHS